VQDFDGGVFTARWDRVASNEGARAVREGVREFARAHGMPSAARHDLDVAVGEAVAGTCVSAGCWSLGRVVLDAATDGRWLSVRVTGDAPWIATSEAEGLPLGTALAASVEWGPGAAGIGTAVVLEFVVSDADTHTQGDRRRPDATAASRSRIRRSHDRRPAVRGRRRRV